MPIHKILSFAAVLAFAVQAHAQVDVQDAWVRATVPHQKTTGAFMTLVATQDSKLVAATSPLAGVAEVHEMAMQDNVMRMRHVPEVALPAGQPVELKPGGYHVMLMELKQQVKDGDVVPLTLTIERKDGRREQLQVQARVRPLGASGAAAPASHKH